MSKIHIQLGRYGDILSILPLMWADAQKGEKPRLMVAKEFADVLDGVSYVEPVVFDGSFMEVDRAVELAKTMADEVSISQLAGPQNEVLKAAWEVAGLSKGQPSCDSFVKEGWRLAGRFSEWRNNYPLAFDQRDSNREQKLIAKYNPGLKPQILVALGGKTSPFPYAKMLLWMLKKSFPKTDIVDLGEIKAERIYDLLGLIQFAKCLVACDSAVLHLANAYPKCPVVALTQDKPTLFHGSPWRAQHVAYCRYGDFTERFETIIRAIKNIGTSESPYNPKQEYPALVHVWSEYDITDENRNRHSLAYETWREARTTNRWIPTPLEIGAVGRDSTTVFNDKARYPYFKDAIRLATYRAGNDDWIVLTRCDSQFSNTLTEDILASDVPLFCQRLSQNGRWSNPAIDFFAFKRPWWIENQMEVPDFILGPDPHWSRTFMQFIIRKGGRQLAGAIHREKGIPIPIVRHGYREHNERLCKTWMEAHGIVTVQPKLQQQAEVKIVNPSSLLPFAYNPSIIRYQDELLMTYRAHSENDAKSNLWICELDNDLNLRKSQRLHIPDEHCHEDGRFFTIGDDLYLSYVESLIHTGTPTCAQRYGKLEKVRGEWELVSNFRPDYEKNDHKTLQKNWLFFDNAGIPNCIYGSEPEQTVLQLQGATVVSKESTESPRWKWGEIRGGAIVQRGENLLRFFHSRLEDELGAVYWRYYIGCLLMESVPPYKVVRICSAPLLKGSESDDYSVDQRNSFKWWKPNIVIPFGAVKDGEDFLVSIGINDSACGIVRFNEGDLKL